MARPLSELVPLMEGLDPSIKKAWIEGPTKGMEYPCIMIERGLPSRVKSADNIKYLFKKGYTITVIDRAPDSSIPDLVEELPDAEFNRFFRANGLNHFVFQFYF